MLIEYQDSNLPLQIVSQISTGFLNSISKKNLAFYYYVKALVQLKQLSDMSQKGILPFFFNINTSTRLIKIAV